MKRQTGGGRNASSGGKVDKYPRVSFRLGELADEIGSRQAKSKQPSSPNEVVQRDLLRYYELLARSLPDFSEREAVLILKAVELAGVSERMTSRFNERGMISAGGRRVSFSWPVDPDLLWAVVDTATVEGGRVMDRQAMAGIDAAALVKKLRGLSSEVALAVLDATERGLVLLEKGTDPREAVRRVGLTRDKNGR